MITLKPRQIENVFYLLRDLIDANENPFKGQAKRLLYEMQPEVKYLQEATAEDIDAIKDREIEFGQKIVAPEYYPDEYTDLLRLVCVDVKKKESRLKRIAKE